MKNIKNLFKIIKSECKEIKWTKPKDVARQTFYSFGIITIAMAIYMTFDTGVQMILSYIIK